MATGLLVTFTWVETSCERDTGAEQYRAAMSTQFMTFMDVGPAQKALDAIKDAHKDHNVAITGTIVKDIVI